MRVDHQDQQPLGTRADRIGVFTTALSRPGRTPDGHSTPRGWPDGPEAARERAHTTGHRRNTKRIHITRRSPLRRSCFIRRRSARNIPSLAASLPSPSPSFACLVPRPHSHAQQLTTALERREVICDALRLNAIGNTRAAAGRPATKAKRENESEKRFLGLTRAETRGGATAPAFQMSPESCASVPKAPSTSSGSGQMACEKRMYSSRTMRYEYLPSDGMRWPQ